MLKSRRSMVLGALLVASVAAVWFAQSGGDPAESAENRRRLALAVEEFEALQDSLAIADPVGLRTTVACDTYQGFGVVSQHFSLRDGVSVLDFGEQAAKTLLDRGYRLLDLHGTIAKGSTSVEDWYMAITAFEDGAGDLVIQLEFPAADCTPGFFPN